MIFDQKVAEKTAELLLGIKAVTFRFDPPYTYTSGLRSPIYLDNRLVMSHPTVRSKIVDSYILVLKKKIGLSNVDYISATASAAIPQASFVSYELNLPMVFVRPTTKTYGKGNKVEGYLKPGSKVVIVEDHISMAVSVTGNAIAIRGLKGKVKYCIATTTYETKKSEELLKENNVKIISLTSGKIIVEQAFKKGLLTKKQKKSVDSWFQDPPNWKNII
jgi:orotate phosphoribosyltransferase